MTIIRNIKIGNQLLQYMRLKMEQLVVIAIWTKIELGCYGAIEKGSQMMFKES